MAYTAAQLKGIWLANAKGTKYDTQGWANLMAAIGLAESSGIANRVNPNDNGGKQSSYGLWQISNGTHSPPAGNWADPNANARLAIGKLDTQGLTAWGTYDSGAYKRYLSGVTPVTGAGPGPGGSSGGGSSSGGGGSGTPANCLISWPSFGLGPVHAGGGCIFSKSQARGLIGGLMLGPGIGLTVVGAVVLAAFAFRRSGAAAGLSQATGTVVGILPGLDGAGAAVSRAGGTARASNQGPKREAERAAAAERARDRNDEKQYDEVAARKRDSAKGPALRDRELEPAPF